MKVSYLNQKNVNKCFECFRIPMFMNICERFPYPYEFVYFTYSYLGVLFFGRGYATLGKLWTLLSRQLLG